MRALLVVAKEYEARAIAGDRAAVDAVAGRFGPYDGWPLATPKHEVWVVVGGVGPAAAAAATASCLALEPFDLAASVGIGGGFVDIALGALVVATEVVSADLGVHLEGRFAAASEMAWAPDGAPCDAAFVALAVGRAGAVAGPLLTVSAMTGTDARAMDLQARHAGALAEAMEGAGVAVAAGRWGVRFGELRAVSNRVGRFDQSTWAKEAALARLAAGLAAVFGEGAGGGFGTGSPGTGPRGDAVTPPR